jgi:hypothetical protein
LSDALREQGKGGDRGDEAFQDEAHVFPSNGAREHANRLKKEARTSLHWAPSPKRSTKAGLTTQKGEMGRCARTKGRSITNRRRRAAEAYERSFIQ